jgi:hypothetical protein
VTAAAAWRGLKVWRHPKGGEVSLQLFYDGLISTA